MATKHQSTQFELCPLHLGNLDEQVDEKHEVKSNTYFKEEYNMKNMQILNFS